jgi:hypothetical protein
MGCELPQGPSPLALVPAPGTSDSGDTNDSGDASTGPIDPAYAMTVQEIRDLYSNAACNVLSEDDPVVDGPDDSSPDDGTWTGDADYYRRGLRAHVYIPPAGFNSNDWLSLDRYLEPDVTQLPNVLYFFNLDVPTRPFDSGFPLFDGSLIQDNSLESLLEYFRIHFEGMVTLGPDNSEGDYEFAMLSDDGARLKMGVDKQVIIDNPQDTPSKLMCATQRVHMRRGFEQPFDLEWFQGPRYHIANMLLWRKASDDAEPLCGSSGNDMWFDYNAGPYVPRQPFLDLQSRGWKVVGAENFRLPQDEVLNPCLSQRVREIFDDQN